MKNEIFSRYLTERYEDQINWYDLKAIAQQKKYLRMQWAVIILAALTPILVEIDLSTLGKGTSHLPTLTAVIVAVLTASLKTFKYQENWINYRTTCETLRKEKHFYDASLGDYGVSKDKEGLFVDRVESLISRENTMWVSAHKAIDERQNGNGKVQD